MAIEPYRPNDGQYRDDLDRELDKKIDKFFHRWNWKLFRFIRTCIFVAIGIWLAVNLLPPVFDIVFSGELGPMILQFLPIAAYLFFFIGFQFFLMYFFMARTRIYWVRPGEMGISFKDYRGNPEVLEAARRVVTLLKGAKEFKKMGGEVTRGILLVGPPGTGKSYLAQAISTEAGVPFGYLSAPSLQSAWMGMGNIKVMNLYRKARRFAREYGACIIFIDEIDAIGMARSRAMAGGGPLGMGADKQAGGSEQVVMGMGGMMGGGSGILNELLLQMDPPPQDQTWLRKLMRLIRLQRGKAEMPPVLTMGATNMAETLDAALLRPGRFDRKIAVEHPDGDGRRDVIEYYLSKVKHEPMPIDRMVSDTIGYTPVAIKYCINEATIHAHFDNRAAINYWDFTQARETHEMGLRQPIRSMSYEERRRIAYHEAGHAYVMVKLLKKERLTKVTIIRHGSALGFAAWKPEEEIHTRTKDELLDRIKISLGSRAAEELFLNIQMSGVTGDLASATATAAYMLGVYGMGDSLFSYLALGGIPQDGALRKPIDDLLSEQYRQVKQLIDQNREAVIAIAEALIMRNELTDIDVKEILDRVEVEHPYMPISAKKEQAAFGFASVARSNGGATLVRRRREAAPPPVLPAPGTIIIDAALDRETREG